MKMTINDQRKVVAIRAEFTSVFPNLKLDFYSKPHTSGGANSLKLIHGNQHTLEECRNIHNDGIITITPQMNVSDLEQQFMDVYGIKIQVSGKSAQSGSAFAADENLTLEQQNQRN